MLAWVGLIIFVTSSFFMASKEDYRVETSGALWLIALMLMLGLFQ